jgi:type I restriction enzyme S subunit
MEAETFLSRGYGIRVGIKSQTAWLPLSALANVWQPSRLKGIQVGPKVGTPFLAATQVFDLRPQPRKWLALSRTKEAAERFVSPGQILVTCSGAVGRATLAYAPHLETLITHDLLRVDALDRADRGWLYAYLRAPRTREMMGSTRYGHVIKHLEPAHLRVLPVPDVNEEWRKSLDEDFQKILALRDAAHAARIAAERHFAECVGPINFKEDGEHGFVVHARDGLFQRRRRLEAAAHNPRVTQILEHFAASGLRTEALGSATARVWWLSRFKRVFGEGGVRYLSSDELFQVNPDVAKRVLVEQANEAKQYFAKRGWIVMACSGQTYGLLGSARLVSRYEEDAFLSHDIIRIMPKKDGPPTGYLVIALTHHKFGRPLVLRFAYGTSIPHLEPADVASCEVVRLKKEDESIIADLADKAAELRSRADVIENKIADAADGILDRFAAGEKVDLRITNH